jgi:CheY-like chemotaxis protein
LHKLSSAARVVQARAAQPARFAHKSGLVAAGILDAPSRVDLKGGRSMNRTAVSRSLSGELRLVEQETSLRILLAEDDHELRRLLTLILHRDGHEIVEARDGGELLEALAATLLEPKRPDFDLIICEHALPGIPGLTVLAGLRSRDRDLPFILITGNVLVAANARRLGAVILRQPLSVEAIRSAIRRSAALAISV